MRRPSISFLPPALAEAAKSIASRLEAAGHRAWIVGGAPRDLALGREVSEIDMASSATPEEVETLFERVTAVGRAFGTLIVHAGGVAVQLTSFRSERGFSDARRPDEVRYGHTLEEDSGRRDFTCNALYLDPLEDRFADPQGGFADLEARRLCSVGDPAQRFQEDGLRLVRMARFAAGLELEIDPPVLSAARVCGSALGGVSPERLLGELHRIFAQSHPSRAVRILWECGLLERLLPGQAALHPPDLPAQAAQELRLGTLEHGSRGSEGLLLPSGLCVLLDPSPRDPESKPGDFEAAWAVLDRLRPSRKVRRDVLELWRIQRDAECLFMEAIASRARRIRLVRDEHWPAAARLIAAWRRARGEALQPIEEFEQFAASLPPAELRPEPWLRSSDLGEAGVPRGPRWRTLLEESETLQLDQRLTTRQQALAWLAEHAGGSSPR